MRATTAAAALLAAGAIGCSSAPPAQPPPNEFQAQAEATGSSAPGTSVEPDVLEPSEPFGRTTVELTSPNGETSVTMPVYDAFDDAMRQRGLMHREELPATAGMVFRFAEDRTGGFWMRDTLIPLSIAYFDADGEVITVLDMEPCTTVTCPSYAPDAAYRGALEVNQGYFAEVGLEPGWRVTLPADLPAPA